MQELDVSLSSVVVIRIRGLTRRLGVGGPKKSPRQGAGLRHAEFATVRLPPAGDFTAWFPGTATRHRGAGPSCLPLEDKGVGYLAEAPSGSARVPCLTFLEGIGEVQGYSNLIRRGSGGPGTTKELHSQTARNQRQDT